MSGKVSGSRFRRGRRKSGAREPHATMIPCTATMVAYLSDVTAAAEAAVPRNNVDHTSLPMITISNVQQSAYIQAMTNMQILHTV